MRLIVFFDLPTETLANKRDYRYFRKFLIKKGFLMLQESVYCKLLVNTTAANSIISSIHKNSPKEGVIQSLLITERQYSRMDYICGTKDSNFVDSDDRILIL